MLQPIQINEDCLKRKKEQLLHQEEKLEELQRTIQDTKSQIEQLEYIRDKQQQLSKERQKQRVIPYSQVHDFFRHLCQVYEYLEHRFHSHFKYKMACLLIFARYRFQSRSHSPGREYLSFTTVLTYFKNERGMVGCPI